MQDGEQFIVLLRHGIAEDRTPEKSDSERELTSDGLRRMKEIARGLARLLPKVEAIVSSPLRRAQQTAACVARAYKGRIEAQTSEALVPNGDAQAFHDLLARLKVRRAIFVGHEPNLTILMLALTRMEANGAVELKKGGCYGIRLGDAAHLEWMLPPRVLRRL